MRLVSYSLDLSISNSLVLFSMLVVLITNSRLLLRNSFAFLVLFLIGWIYARDERMAATTLRTG